MRNISRKIAEIDKSAELLRSCGFRVIEPDDKVMIMVIDLIQAIQSRGKLKEALEYLAKLANSSTRKAN